MTIPYARQLLSSPTVGQDFRAFFAAATVVGLHGDPYDCPSLAGVEDQLYDASRHLAPGDPAFYEFLAYPEGPWLAFALVPLTVLPWQAADAIYTSLLLLVLVGASFTVFALLGWRPPRAWLGAACAALSAVGFINLFMGQVSVIVFGAFIVAWYLAGRGHGGWAGLALALIWLQPNIRLPLPLVIVLLEPAMARRVIGGSLCAAGGALGAPHPAPRR